MSLSSYDEYQHLALRTLNDKGTVMNMVHCAMGMAGEASELYELVHTNSTLTGAVGEVGDCAWYAAVCAHAIGVKFSDIVYRAEITLSDATRKESLDPMIIHGGHMLEWAKKHLFYGAALDRRLFEEAIVGYIAGLLAMANAINCSFEDACFRNINKLRERFPEKFEAEKAINRDYTAESKAAGVTIV